MNCASTFTVKDKDDFLAIGMYCLIIPVNLPFVLSNPFNPRFSSNLKLAIVPCLVTVAESLVS